MSDRIEPALDAEEWESKVARRGAGYPSFIAMLEPGLTVVGAASAYEHEQSVEVVTGALPALIALANAALPDTDPRKITREKVELIRDGVQQIAAAVDDMRPSTEKADARALSVALGAFADALESYLPPE